jgi:hypothetical protein
VPDEVAKEEMEAKKKNPQRDETEEFLIHANDLIASFPQLLSIASTG